METEKILLVDDDRSILEAYQNILVNEGYQVDIAESGEVGLEFMQKNEYRIVITDLKFSPYQMDGFQIIQGVKKINPDCEVIVITGYSDLELAIKAMHFDASDFIPKPCRKKDLLLAIKRASEKLQMRRLVREYTETLKKMVDKNEEEMARIEERLIHTAKLSAMGEMAASICHELRQPLCGIMGFTYMASEDIPENTKAKEYIRKVEEQITRMDQIVKNISIFSRKSDEGFFSLHINEVVHSAVCLFSHQFKNHGIQLLKDLAKDIPQITGNKAKLQQVLVNLLSNARDALDEVTDERIKKVTVKTAYHPDEKMVEISITDNGIGIEEGIREKIFQSFYTTKGEDRGTGLGLSVSKSIISDHEGEITVDSQKGFGSHFKISLPVSNLKKSQENDWHVETSDQMEAPITE
ncbi:MAG: ATP-binding protein [bacterium]